MSQKELEFRIGHSTEPVRTKYQELLEERRGELVRSRQLPPTVSHEEKIALYEKALRVGQYGSADSKKMAEDWDYYNIRPPVGGAKDD